MAVFSDVLGVARMRSAVCAHRSIDPVTASLIRSS
jgi:hypothetical protein